jgi:putative endonuclease
MRSSAGPRPAESARPADPSRTAAHRRGRLGEIVAALWLRLKFYRILGRGQTVGRGSGAGEVDLIVRRGNLVAFVEVKSRPDLTRAAEALTPAQRRRIERGAAAFLSRRPDLAGCDVRFDLMLLAPGRWPRHLPDAWRPGDGT